MGEAVDYEAANEENERLSNLALANAYILLALVRLDDYHAYGLFHLLETCAEVESSVELNVSIANYLEQAGIGPKEIENIWEVLDTEEGKHSVKELFKSSNVVRGLVKEYRESAWKIMKGVRSSEWPSMAPASYLFPVLTISEVNRVLDFLEKRIKLNPRLMGLVVNMNAEFSREDIQAIFKYVRDQLMHQTNEGV